MLGHCDYDIAAADDADAEEDQDEEEDLGRGFSDAG